MLKPAEFLDVARSLASPASTRSPSDVELRRSVSTAYYAVFHTILAAAAERFVGTRPARSSGYTILYRSFDHGRMRRICEDLVKPALSRDLRRQLGRPSVHAEVRAFAWNFTVLQRRRHSADYDPSTAFEQDDALIPIEEAACAIAGFDRVPDNERTDVPALLLTGGRS